jgi:hypothetical protein
MTIEDIYSRDCRGTVFDGPCPDSWIAEHKVIGMLTVEPDPSFGGGALKVAGVTQSGEAYQMAMDGSFKVEAASDVVLTAGDNARVNSAGGEVRLEAGAGTSVDRGAGDPPPFFFFLPPAPTGIPPISPFTFRLSTSFNTSPIHPAQVDLPFCRAGKVWASNVTAELDLVEILTW